ncbi:MAG: protease complex subunit PrcB family protein [Candidatus Bathyarchaeia archaeon]
MRFRDKISYGLFALAFLLVFPVLVSSVDCASEQEISFEILEMGDYSGYGEEAYIVVRDEDEWINLWERHTIIREPQEFPPYIDFSRSIVICAFMGKRSTTGYSIFIERVWTDGEHVFVEVAKRGPPEGFATNQMVTYPYIMAVMERVDMPFVFRVVEEDGKMSEYILTEYGAALFQSFLLVFLLVVTVLIIKRLNLS